MTPYALISIVSGLLQIGFLLLSRKSRRFNRINMSSIEEVGGGGAIEMEVEEEEEEEEEGKPPLPLGSSIFCKCLYFYLFLNQAYTFSVFLCVCTAVESRENSDIITIASSSSSSSHRQHVTYEHREVSWWFQTYDIDRSTWQQREGCLLLLSQVSLTPWLPSLSSSQHVMSILFLSYFRAEAIRWGGCLSIFSKNI